MHRIHRHSLLALAFVAGLTVAAPAAAIDGIPFCTAVQPQDATSIAVSFPSGTFVAWRDLRRSTTTTFSDIYVTMFPPIIAARANELASHGGTPSVSGFVWPVNGIVACQSGTASAPGAVPDGEGGVLILFSDGRIPRGIYAQRVRADGTLAPGFPANGKLVTSDVYDLQHAACSDGAGGAYFIRTRYSPGGGVVVATVSRVTKEGVIAPGWTETGVGVGGDEIVEGIAIGPDPSGGAVTMVRTYFNGMGTDVRRSIVGRVSADAGLALLKQIPGPSFPGVINARVVADGAGGIFAAWNNSTAADFYGQHWAANGAATWPADHPVPAMEGLVSDGAGGVYLVGRPKDGTAKLRVARYDAAGASDPAWDPAGITIVEPTLLGPVQAVASGTGVGILWSQSSGGPTGYDLRTTMYRQNGHLGLGYHAGGEILCNAVGNQVNASCGDGIFLVVWEDDRAPATAKDLWMTYFQGPTGEVGVEPGAGARALALRAGPSPTHAGTTFACTLPAAGDVTIEVFAVGGRVVRTLQPGRWSAGEQRAAWDGNDDAGRASPPGVYLARITVGDDVASGRVVRLP